MLIHINRAFQELVINC